jgi:rSAM/selenodomain-associated transferase 1
MHGWCWIIVFGIVAIMTLNTLFLMAKYPQAGTVKSRLIPALGAAKAAQLAESFLLDLMERLARTSFPFPITKVLCFDPPESKDRFKTLLHTHAILNTDFILLPQTQGNLGERLKVAVQSQFGRDSSVVFIGADAPDIQMSEIQIGFNHAQQGRAYLQHASDGGYVLLALPANLNEDVFAEVPWSQADTGVKQAARLRKLNMPLIESPSIWSDVDLPDDLAPLLRRLENNSTIAPRTLKFLRGSLERFQLMAEVLAPTPSTPPILPSLPNLVWHDAAKLTISGKGWLNESRHYERFPIRAEAVIPPQAWMQSLSGSGIAIRFESDAEQIYARWFDYNNEWATNQAGNCQLTLYVYDSGRWRYLGSGRQIESTPV